MSLQPEAYFSEEDVQNLDRMLAVAEEAEKLVSMDWSSAWYVYAFFGVLLRAPDRQRDGRRGGQCGGRRFLLLFAAGGGREQDT